jgi:hypothetical protein
MWGLADACVSEPHEDVLLSDINPGRVFDYQTNLRRIDEAYAAMAERRDQVTRARWNGLTTAHGVRIRRPPLGG